MLKDGLIKKTATTTSTVSTEIKNKVPPKGAEIIEQNVRTETEEIENGFLVTKTYDGRYIAKGSEDKYGTWFNYNKKWFSKEDPLTITINDAALADAFDDSEEK